MSISRFYQDIDNLRVRAESQRYYIDPKDLKALCTYERLLEVVKECDIPRLNSKRLAQRIYDDGVVTFSILVYCHQENLIVQFLETDLSGKLDHQLPMTADQLDNIVPGGRLKKFEEHQWQFKPVILERSAHKQIGDKYILPYIEDVHHGDHDGSFGRVSIVTMKSSMQTLLETEAPTVKVFRKQLLLKGDERSFEKEREVLSLLRQIEHPNIAELLCSYIYNQEYSLLFEVEDMDLADFLKLDYRYKDFESNTTFFTAFYGLASALEIVHNCSLEENEESFTVIGSHHDIRPQNILVRANDFLLTDFGLAKMSDKDSSSKTPYKAGFGEYAAPECMNNDHESENVGRAIDIWSLGAMMVDIASYVYGGAEGKRTSVQKRKEAGPKPLNTNTRFHANGCLKTGVKQWIGFLERDAEEKTLRTFLKLSRNMLVPQNDRPDISTVRQNASYIAIKSLFRAALKKMIDFRRDTLATTPDKNWEDLWKLSAWGEEIDLNSAKLVSKRFADAMRDGQNSERTLQKTLLKLVKQLDTRPFQDHRLSRRASSGMASPQNSYMQKVDDIGKLVSDLKRTLPTRYQDDLNKRKHEMFRKAADATEVPELPEESLQDSPALESVLVPSDDALAKNTESFETSQEPLSRNKNDRFLRSLPIRPEGNGSPFGASGTLASTSRSSERNSPSVSNTPGNISTNITTPEVVRGKTPEERPERILHSSFLSQDSISYLPDPLVPKDGWDETHGAFLAGTGIVADLAFTSHKPRMIHCEVHVRSNPGGQGGNTVIFCNGIDEDTSIRHDLSQSDSRYPHVDPPIDANDSCPTVHFLGRQILEERRGMNGEHHSPPFEQTQPQNVEYIFSSPGDCDRFRELAWGKSLIISTGINKLRWRKSAGRSTKANTICLSAWKLSNASTVVFWARENDVKKHIELEIATSTLLPRRVTDNEPLVLKVWPPDSKTPAAGTKPQELHIEFHSRKDKSRFWNNIIA